MARTTELGNQLRELRGELPLREMAQRVGLPDSTLSRYETGARTPNRAQLRKILDALDMGDSERERLLAMVPHRRRGPGELVIGVPSGQQLAQVIGYERAANRITEVSPLLIPGLLQTRDYAQVVLSGGGTERRVRMRLERAEILTRNEQPVEYRALIDSTVLTRQIAPPDVMRAQLRHVQEMAELPNVTVQVIPHEWGPHLAGPFIVFDFPDDEPQEEGPIVHVEHYRGGVFLWDDKEVRSFVAAADEIARKAMTPARSAEVIKELEQSL